jgi:SAM-dependent methyltransferase
VTDLRTAPELEAYGDWLRALPRHEFFHALSRHRPYATPEEAYDTEAAIDFHRGRFLADAVAAVAPGLAGVCLEIGCGTGRLTCGLVQAGRFDRYLVTDASAGFLRITRGKLERAGLATSAVDFGLFNGEDFEGIRFDRFGLIALRSVLHHIADYKAVFAALARRLKPGGVVALLEPRAEFFLMTSTLLGLLPALAAQAGTPLDEAEAGHVRGFEDATRFYLDRTVDKSAAEDRYAFTGDELFDLAAGNGMTLHRMGGEYRQNYSFDVADYLRYCMSFPDALMEKVDRALGDPIRRVDEVLKDLRPLNAAEWLLFRKGG